MTFSLVRRQLVMAVALVAGVNVKTFAAENLLNKIKERGTLQVGLEGTYPPFSFQDEKGMKWSSLNNWRSIWASRPV